MSVSVIDDLTPEQRAELRKAIEAIPDDVGERLMAELHAARIAGRKMTASDVNRATKPRRAGPD